MIPFLDLTKQVEPLKEEIMSKINEVLDKTDFIMGEEVELFEKEVANYLNVKHAITCANGSDALLLALMALGVERGDEVITSPFTFFATAGAISRLGAVPVFVDIDPQTYNIDPSLIEEKITSKTKAIIPVHIFGQSADMSMIKSIARKYNLGVIEDAAQAIGAKFNDLKVGGLGDIACFSFFPTKNLGCFGDGGLLTTNNDELASYLRKARVHGAYKKYHHEFVGFNSRLDTLQAGVLRVKLPHLDSWNSRRREIAYKYNEAFKDYLVVPFEKNYHVYHQYSLLASDSTERDAIMLHLKENGISSGIYYPVPLHMQECFKDLGYDTGSLGVSENISSRVFSIPIYPEVDYMKVIEVLTGYFKK